ncbi:MAG: sirohydrochlorin cobaltochelatase, partial [Bacteroidaceae bacterium]|nr:sirohydrochlorin cobaltochelatase [Bacteroidaceae bacterium]
MKKIKVMLVAAIAALGMVSCSDDDKTTIENNIVSEYQYNDNLVANQKKASGKKEAVLLVAFGSTWSNAFAAFDNTKKQYEAAFPNADVYVSFSSDICINRASAGENGEARDYYEPRYLLHAIGAAKYDKIYIQSLQVIPGEEFANVVACVKK